MPPPTTSNGTTSILPNIKHELLPGIQGQNDAVSLNDEGQQQEPRVPDNDGDNPKDRNLRVRYVRTEFDENGDLHEKPGKRINPTNDSPKEEDSNVAFVVKEIWKNDKIKEKTDIVLKGQELREIMYHVLAKQLAHDQNRHWLAQEQIIADPVQNEIWYWNELCSIAKSNRGSEQGRRDLQLLLDHLHDIMPNEIKLMKCISSVTKILAKDLKWLFRPGTLVISKPFQDEPHLFRVHECHLHGGSIDEDRAFVVVAWAFNWTGIELIQEYHNFDILQSGDKNQEMTITDLPCYPVNYFKNSDGAYDTKAVEALKSDLIARGKLFRRLCREPKYRKQHTYEGEVLTDDKDSYILDRLVPRTYDLPFSIRGHDKKKYTVKSDIMIDFEAYKLYSLSGIGAHGSLRAQAHVVACKCQLCFDKADSCTEWMRNFAADSADEESAATDANYLLLPARVLGYCFNPKIWAQFYVKRVRAIDPPNVAKVMGRLVFPEEAEGVKEDLKTLIEQHGKTGPPLIVDPIKGKGTGLVILLHGPPGVGKTLTAETLAKCAGKPLYVVGASDVGLDPKVAEASLRRVFELAERWDAVLLIDEADVFLDSRGTKGEADMSKNALVSVMLRVLEYFKGILIMTTNRVMTFDVAMLSRCHYAVNFRSLTLHQEQRIWHDYVRQLTDRNSKEKHLIEDWVRSITKKKTKLSGREIRNVFTTAQTLAQAEPSKKIERKHLERVYDRLTEFSDEMEKNKNTQQALLNASY